MSPRHSLRVDLADDAATVRLGQDIAAALRVGDVVALTGDLGAGKSTLARAVIRALAANPDLEVPSPTFTLVQSYATVPPVHHYDLYRLGDPDELFELGFDEAAKTGICLVEWPQMAEPHIPVDRIGIVLSEGKDGGRTAEVDAQELARLQRAFAQRFFLDENGWSHADRAYLSGDASSRRYELVERDGEEAILVDSPPLVLGPVIREEKSYAEIAHIAQDCKAFAAVGSMLAAGGMRVPALLATDISSGFLLIEDLGTGGVLDSEKKPITERYLAATEMLAAMHARHWPKTYTGSDFSYEIPPFDHDAILVEADLLLDWYVPEVTGNAASADMRLSFSALWHAALGDIADAEKTLMLRDFHSPNILWQDGARGTDRIGLIDFQDALWGPSAYDLASLAFDARVDIEPDLERSIFKRYCAARRKNDPQFDAGRFEHAYALMAAQRNSKILGIFVRLNRRDGKPAYMRHLPRIRAYLERALNHPRLEDLRAFYRLSGFIGNGA